MYLFQPCSGPLCCLLETLARACFTGKAGVHFKILCKESWKKDFKYPSLGSHAKRVGAGRGRDPLSGDLFTYTTCLGFHVFAIQYFMG